MTPPWHYKQLLISPRDTKRAGVMKIDEARVLAAFESSNALIAEQYLEHLILNKGSTVCRIHFSPSKYLLINLMLSLIRISFYTNVYLANIWMSF
jgi:predicted SAM-dependent methyltransferase